MHAWASTPQQAHASSDPCLALSQRPGEPSTECVPSKDQPSCALILLIVELQAAALSSHGGPSAGCLLSHGGQ